MIRNTEVTLERVEVADLIMNKVRRQHTNPTKLTAPITIDLLMADGTTVDAVEVTGIVVHYTEEY